MNALAGKNGIDYTCPASSETNECSSEEKSGIPLEIPLLRMEGMSHRQIQHIEEQLHSYDWVIFTSRNGVAFF